MRSEGLDLTISSPELSEADLLTAYIEHRDSTRAQVPSPLAKVPPPLSPIPHRSAVSILRQTGEEKRKSSLENEPNQQVFPTDLIAAIGLPSEYWLRHQSLPNIQEIGEEESAGSPTHSKTTARMSFRKPNSSEVAELSKGRGSFKRQKSVDKSSPPKLPPDHAQSPPASASSPSGSQQPAAAGPQMVRKGSAEERRRRYSSQGNSSSNSYGSASALPISARRYRKRMPLQSGSKTGTDKSKGSTTTAAGTKQSSTESENSANSYKTAKSFYIQISEEADETAAATTATPVPPLSGDASTSRKEKISLIDVKKSSQSTSSSYSSARENLNSSRPSISAADVPAAAVSGSSSRNTTATTAAASAAPVLQQPETSIAQPVEEEAKNKKEKKRRRSEAESNCIGS